MKVVCHWFALAVTISTTFCYHFVTVFNPHLALSSNMLTVMATTIKCDGNVCLILLAPATALYVITYNVTMYKYIVYKYISIPIYSTLLYIAYYKWVWIYICTWRIYYIYGIY